MARLHLFDLENFTLPEPEADKADLPYYLADFVDLWNHSISSRLMIDAATPLDEEVPTQVAYDF